MLRRETSLLLIGVLGLGACGGPGETIDLAGDVVRQLLAADRIDVLTVKPSQLGERTVNSRGLSAFHLVGETFETTAESIDEFLLPLGEWREEAPGDGDCVVERVVRFRGTLFEALLMVSPDCDRLVLIQRGKVIGVCEAEHRADVLANAFTVPVTMGYIE